MTVHGRGAGVAIVRDRFGRFAGRALRIGTAWQAWVPLPSGELRFAGWASLRRSACSLIEKEYAL